MVESGHGTLHVVSTPIGNMGDFSFRGVQVLREVSIVLAEDTRHARHLLTHYDITTPLLAYHEHNEARTVPLVLQRLTGGENVALISDAGTPLLSDPGDRLVRAAIESGITVTAVPGASALLAALVIAGLPVSPFTYHGFLPRKGGERKTVLLQIAECGHTVVIYEAANRLPATLRDLERVCGGERLCAVTRELTKMFEEARRGTLSQLAEYYEVSAARGEVVLVLAGAPQEIRSESQYRELARSLRAGGLSTKDIVSVMVQEHGAPRNLAYRLAQEK
jgi:16S rRNA (cytidine1402-2'-O)-methyltransferase